MNRRKRIKTLSGMVINKRAHYRSLFIPGILIYVAICTVMLCFTEAYAIKTTIFYFSFIAISIFLIWRYEKTASRLCFYLSFLLVLFLLGFRNVSGIDDNVYRRIFEQSSGELIEAFRINGVEKGYIFVNWLLYRLTNGNYYVCQVLLSSIPIFLFYVTLSKRKYGKFLHAPLALIILLTSLYFQMLSVSLVRMFIAISIVFYSLDSLWERNLKRYCSLIIIASMFHMSVLVCLFFIVIVMKKKWIIKYWKRLVILLIAVTPIVFIMIAKYLAPFLGSRYQGYAEVSPFSPSITSFDMVPLIILSLVYKKYIPTEYKVQYMIGVFITCIAVVFSVFSSMVSLGRLIFYAKLGIFIVLPCAYKFIPNRKLFLKLIFLVIVLSYSILYLMITQFKLEHHMPYLFPYRNFFFEF